jgi:hypothetical protein
MLSEHLRLRKRAWTAFISAGILVAIAGCAETGTLDGGAESAPSETLPPSADSGPTINWDLPYGPSAPQFSSATEAEDHLSFRPLIPPVGPPDVIQLTPPGTERMIVMVFHLPEEGTVMVEESAADENAIDGLRAMVEARAAEVTDTAQGEVGSTASYQMISFRGTEAMLVQARGIGRIIWIEAGIRVDITGESVTPEQVLALAESF